MLSEHPFFGFYSNKSRGLRLKAQEKSQANQGNAAISYAPPPPKKACSKKWAELIKLVYEVNPLSCPRCSHLMRIISIIDQQETIEKILKHLGLWQPQAHGPPMNKEEKIIEETVYDYSFFDYLPT